MSLVQQLHQRLTRPWYQVIPWWKLFKGSVYLGALCVVFSQCASLSILADAASTPSLVMVGEDKLLVDTEDVPEEKKQKRFVQDSMELMWSSSPYLPKELDESCTQADKSQCSEQRVPDVKAFGHTLPATQAYASQLASVEYQPAVIKTMIANKPKKGQTTAYRADFVTPPKPVAGQFGTFECVVRGAMYTQESNGETWGKRDNRMVRFRVIDKPTSRPKTLFQQEIDRIRKLGYEITLVKPIR